MPWECKTAGRKRVCALPFRDKGTGDFPEAIPFPGSPQPAWVLLTPLVQRRPEQNPAEQFLGLRFSPHPRLSETRQWNSNCVLCINGSSGFYASLYGQFKESKVQKILAVADTEVFGKLHHLVISDGVDSG